jgi:hypothetical protein
MQRRFMPLVAILLLLPLAAQAQEVRYFDVPRGDHPHDVAPAPDGTVWYTGQHKGVLGPIRRPVRSNAFPWATDRARMASSSVPTAPPG